MTTFTFLFTYFFFKAVFFITAYFTLAEYRIDRIVFRNLAEAGMIPGVSRYSR
jgi:hypothetical protein